MLLFTIIILLMRLLNLNEINIFELLIKNNLNKLFYYFIFNQYYLFLNKFNF